MKILFCCEFYYPYIGGVEIHTKKLADFFSKNNKVEIATSSIQSNFSTKNYISNKKIKVNRFNIKGNLVKGYSGDISKYEDFLLNGKFDVIFFNAAQQWTFDLALPILDYIKSKKIFFPCGFSRINNILYKPYYYLLQKKINYIDSIICCSKDWQDYKFIKKFYKKKIYIVNNGADNIKLKKIKFKNDIRKKFLYIANIKYLKGQDRVLDIFKKVKKNSVLFFIYSNKINTFYKKYIFYKIKKFNISNKRHNKRILTILNDSRIHIKKYFSLSDAFISGSRLEYSPLVMYESLAAGIPYFGFDVGICKYIINRKFLGKISNKKNVLIKEINNYDFNKKNQNLINKEFTRYYSWSEILKQYKKII
jgi:glycosyltransferase involved in cell wall biosynthesis